jgi:RimJ/RimL family protein N-acetyltransferase
MAEIVTARLRVRRPRESDRARFVELFCDTDFMIFSGVLDSEEANARFEHMLTVCERLPFAKQPVIEISSGAIVGYTGVDYIDFEGKTRLEWGYRLVPECRGNGYATEASQALISRARQTFVGELIAIIDPENDASRNVCNKLGFPFWKRAPVDGDPCDLYTLIIE